MKIRISLGLALSIFYIAFAHSEELLKTTTTWEGGEIIYPKGKPEITSFKLKINEGDVAPFHCHPVPTLGYILKGKIEIETKNGKKAIFNEGESVVEVFRTGHRGKAIGESVEVIVFYAGTTTMLNSVMSEADPDFTFCNDWKIE